MESSPRPDFSALLTEVSADAQRFWHAQRDHTLLVVSEKVARAGSSFLRGSIILALVSAAVLMLSMAAAYLVADRVGSLALGFLCVGGCYLLLLVLILLLWKAVLGEKVQLRLINALYGKD